MNIALDLSKGQLSKLRNGHGIRINPTMFGSGVDLIVDPMTYHNMAKKLDKDKGVIIKLGMSEIDMNKMEGTGLFAGAGNKSGKISRRKKAGKWKDFAVETGRDGIDLARYGYEQYKEATNPIASEGKKALKGLSKMFGGEMEGDGLFDDIKKGYNKKVKNSKLGSAVRESAGMAIGDVYDRGAKELGKNKYGKPLSQYMKDTKGSNVKRLTGYTGLGLKLAGDGKMKKKSDFRFAVEKRPDLHELRSAVEMRPAVMPRRKFDREEMEKLMFKGRGLRMSGGMCQGCGMQNDAFIFADQAI
jgi:hypothetical protein